MFRSQAPAKNIIKVMFIILMMCILVSPLQCSPCSDYYCFFEVTGYYPDYWQIPIPDIRFEQLTRVIFFCIYPNSDGTLNTSEINLSRQQEFVQTARSNDVKVSICVGGWGLSQNFSTVAASPSIRSVFINQLIQYCQANNFDGVDLDWEPVSTAADRDNYTLLIQELKGAMSSHGLTLSVAVMGQGGEFNTAAIPYIDRVHVMAYDMNPDPSLPHSSYTDSISALEHWVAFGFAPSKILLGVPFYGRDSNWEYHSYNSIIKKYAPLPDVDFVDGIHFNGIQTIKEKTRYAVQNGFAGIMFWEFTGDTTGPTSLLSAISDEILLTRRPDFNCDSLINVSDLSHISQQWLSTGCATSTAWCEGADIDQSGYINMDDFASFAAYWLQDLE